MPVPYNGGQSPLEAAAIAQRAILIPINIYNNYAQANEYTATHTRALSDQTTPVPVDFKYCPVVPVVFPAPTVPYISRLVREVIPLILVSPITSSLY